MLISSNCCAQVYLAAIEGYILCDMLHTFCEFLEFCYLVCKDIVTSIELYLAA